MARPNIRSSRKGQALVEAALSILVFLCMLLGILDFGLYLYFEQSLVERTRAAARYAVLDPTQTGKIKNMAIYNTPTPGDGAQPLLSALTSEMISITSFDLGSPEGRVRVTISNYPINFVTPGLAGAFKAKPVVVTYPSEAAW